MSARDLVVVAVASAIVLATALWASGSTRPIRQRWAAQLAVGLVCGAVAAVAVAAPFVDIVPDGEETSRSAAILVVALVVAGGVGVAGRMRRSRHQVPRS